MPDREKAIRGLEHCVGEDRPNCENCPYLMDLVGTGCYLRILRDALDILKEQEPKMVVQTTSTIRCPGCGKQITSKGAIHREIKYCWKCGQAVKWND